jgi:hypothetical protein
MRVIDWISYGEADKREASVSGLGGWFGYGQGTWDAPDRWADYLARWDPSTRPYLEALRADVLASDRFICGNEHQYAADGVPLFDDGTVASLSFRAWGDLMAAIATEKDGQNHNYLEFYCR